MTLLRFWKLIFDGDVAAITEDFLGCDGVSIADQMVSKGRTDKVNQ